VSLEPSDNDSAALVASVLAAVDSILDLEHSIWESLNVPQPALEDVVVPSLVDACVACGQPFVLVRRRPPPRERESLLALGDAEARALFAAFDLQARPAHAPVAAAEPSGIEPATA
jgi:hypothetical protein